MITIQKAIKEDIPFIINIENRAFFSPWTEVQITASIDNAYAAKEANVIKGFIIIETILDEVHVLHMAVDPKFQRKGIGKKLMEKAFEFSGKKFFLEVRESNFPAQKLYKGFGFKVISRRKNYYKDNNEDALVMGLGK